MTPARSDHFNGKTYFNPGTRAERGWFDVLKWQLTSERAKWPAWIELAPVPRPPRPTGDEVVATWINHATFLLQTARGNFLTDPVFSDRCSPVAWAGPKRVHAPGVDFAALPKISVVLLSHDHYDHCDLPSLSRLAREHQPVFVAPLGHRDLLNAAGAKQIVELDWWETHALGENCTVTVTPSRHWSRRSVGSTNLRLWGGFAVRTGATRCWFAGDSAYDEELFRNIGQRTGAPDLAMIPIGAYEPRWFMKSAHMNPAEAIQTHLACGARRSVGMHWGTFQLTDEGRDDPPMALAQARAAAGVAPDAFAVLMPGESARVEARAI